MKATQKTVLILGARGRLGAACLTAFQSAGWRALAHRRDGDLSTPVVDTSALAERAAGAQVVLYAVNPPYTAWATEMLPLARAGMDLAERLGATFVLPGNVYGFGETMPALLTPETPERPSTEKGQLRVALEAEMQRRATAGRMRSIVLRAGDFFGAGTGSWLDLVLLKKLADRRIDYPGPAELPHAWAYLPDLARAFVAIAEQVVLPKAGSPQLAAHSRFHFEGHTLTGTQLMDAIDQSAHGLGLSGPLRRSKMPWWPLLLASPFVPMLREVHRMKYLWHVPHALDGAALRHQVGAIPQTPIVEALRVSLIQLGHGRVSVASPSLCRLPT